MALVRLDIETVVVGGGPVSSVVVLRPRDEDGTATRKLPIRVGTAEASAIGMGVDPRQRKRPMTHDLLLNTMGLLGAELEYVSIVDVEGTTFYAQLAIRDAAGVHHSLDSRPSDAIALAVRAGLPMYVEEEVLERASLPDFGAVSRSQQSRDLLDFHDFVENLSPEDFTS